MIKAVLLLLGLGAFSYAQDTPILVDKFGGLNDTDPSATIQNFEAQDALNVESSISGTAILKRNGYTRTASLTVSTSQVNGSFSFIDPNGNKQDIVCHDHYCSKSTNGAAFAVFLSTAGGASCTPKRWSFVQINGILYGANNCRDAIFQYNGTVFSNPATMPAASILELTKDRLAAADVSTNLNGVYYSKSGIYTTFTTGLNSVDPYIDSLGTSGDKITGLKYALGRLYIFKTTSITSCILGDQYTSRCYPISNTIGTNDPLSIVEVPGAVYFRSNDNNYWRLQDDALMIVSKKISNFVKSQTSGSNQNNTQTSQSDWNAGTQFLSGSWNTTSIAGSIFPSSNTFTDTSGADFGAFFSSSNISTNTLAGSVTLAIATFTVSDSSTAASWSNVNNGGTPWATLTNDLSCASSLYGQPGNKIRSSALATAAGTDCNSTGESAGIRLELYIGGTVVFSSTYTTPFQQNTCEITTITMPSSWITNQGQNVKLRLQMMGAIGGGINYNNNAVYVESPSSYPPGAGFQYAKKCTATGGSGSCQCDFAINTSTRYYASGNYTSRTFNTTFSTPIGGPFSVQFTSSTDYASTFQIQDSSDGTTWNSLASISPSNRVDKVNQYWRYKASFTQTTASQTARIDQIDLSAATTGQFVTQCIQPNSNISSWGILNCSQTTAGAGTLVYYGTSAATCATLPTSAPSNWLTTLTNNATITIATNTAVYIGFKPLLASATDQAQVDDCTIYWTNGVAAPPVWGTYDPIKNAIYWTAAVSSSPTSNRVIKYDLNLDQWFPFALNANAIRNIQNVTYFGDSTGGYWNQYGVGSTDNGSSINSYWKSRDFGGNNPFLEKQFSRISLATKNQVTGNLTVTYTLSNNTSGYYTVSLSTTSGINYVRANYNLPLMSAYQFMNVQLGNNSTTPWEIDGLMIDYTARPWRAVNP